MNDDLKLLNEILRLDSPEHSLQLKYIDTPLGPMFSLSDDEYLYLLEFVDKNTIVKEIQTLQLTLQAEITFGDSYINMLVQKELDAYFNKTLRKFSIPIKFCGTEFQNKVWQALVDIPFGEIVSYKTIAEKINSPKAVRAIGNANGMNRIPIIVPCHRVINNSGKIGGYSAGLRRKKYLLELEGIKI